MSQRTIREPVRSQTLDDRGYIPTTNNDRDGNRLRPQPNLAVGDPWDDVVDQVPPPRAAPSLYSQQNHSTPALAPQSSRRSSPPLHSYDDAPPMPANAIDDISVGIESMRFQQRSPHDTRPHHDGAMEIRGRDGTASVYSINNGSNTLRSNHNGGGGGGHTRRTSSGTYDDRQLDAYYEGRPESGGDYYGYDDQPPSASTSNPQQPSMQRQPPPQLYLSSHPQQYQQPYQTQQQPQRNDYYSAPSPYHPEAPSTASYYSPSDSYNNGYSPAVQHPTTYPSHNSPIDRQPSYSPSAYQSQLPNQQQQQQQPAFSTQATHGSNWAQDYAIAAAQNPYYAAATGQLGFPEPYPSAALRRKVSSASSMRSYREGGPGGGPARSGSSINLPSSSASSSSAAAVAARRRTPTGPPITKASVDEYRQRIKADPDPEAQFNFAKYLIEAAKKISASASGDERSAKKYRDALLAESLKLIKRLATQGAGLGKPAYADAQFFLANCLGNGSLGLSIDHEKAYNLYVQASKQNHSSATYRTAVCNEVGAGTRRDHARAVLFYRKASALGDAAGMYKLGMILLNGLLGQQRNRKEAIAWLKRAASQADEDNPHALHELGLLYESAPQPGQPGSMGAMIIPYDPAQARELFTQAAQFGYAPSQFKLGSCYEYGSLTCPVDPRRSIAWYTRAAERGDAESELALSGWYLTGSEGVLKQSDSEAYLWARRAANKGLPKAEYAVGYYSEVGIGAKVDPEEAKRWYMRAAAQGNKRAMQRLTELKQLGAQRDKKAGTARPTRQQAEKECVIM